MQSNAAHPPSLMRETLRMAWPAVLESFFVALASMIDTLMVSSLGSTAVAAVGLTVQPKFFGLCAFYGHKCCGFGFGGPPPRPARP